MKKILSGFLAVMLAFTLTACGSKAHELKIGQATYAAHGTYAYAVATAVVEKDTIVAAYVDEYQYMSSDLTAVPNSENFGDYVAEGYVLGSKRMNSEAYSEHMKEAGSTQSIDTSYNAIQDYVVGKTIDELTELEAKESTEVVDTVAGATLVDTKGYISAIILAAKDAQANEAVTYEGELEGLTLKQTLGAAHGTKCFTLTTVLTAGETVVTAYIDEFQYMNSESTGVPNSENVTNYVAEGYVLCSKRVNTAAYSEHMKEAGSTVAIDVNYDAIQTYVAGKTVTELKELVGKEATEVVDTVTGATLVDTPNYIAEIITTATK